MRTTHWETPTSRTAQGRTLLLERYNTLRLAALTAIVALAAALRLDNLASLGYVNHYYTAAVESMLQSWHNFFFVAAEPGGSVSVDKPPVGLWLQAISAHFFGVNGFGVLLPEIVAGLLSVIVVYHLVRRSFGEVAGLLAALALAITPVVVAVDRNNTIDSTLILTLLLAAWAFIVATERGSLRYLLLGAALVGIGFNIKMLEAYLPLPAFYALYFLGSSERLWRKVGNLTLASVLLVVISLSWATIVDLTPADQRPYVGSSGDNSEISLITGYNGMERLLGMGGRGGLLGGFLGGGNLFGVNPFGGSSLGVPGAGAQPNWQLPGGNSLPQRPFRGGGAFRQPGSGANTPFASRGQTNQGGFGSWLGGALSAFGNWLRGGSSGFGRFGSAMGGTGQAGALRLFGPPLSKEASWLLPLGLFGAVLLAFRARPRWPLAPKHQALVLWGLWLLTDMAFFSVAGFFHPYYLATLGAPLAALVGIGIAELWSIHQRHSWLATILLLIAAGITLRLQVNTATAFTHAIWWLPLVIGLAIAGAVLLLAATGLRWRRSAITGFACIVAALLITPGVWSGLTALNSSANQSLPAAYDGESSGPPNSGGLQLNQALLGYLQSHTQGAKYLMAVPSSMQGTDYVLATGRPVLYLGGFMGQDEVVTNEDLSRMAADGELRYIYWNSNTRGRGLGGQSDISAWVAANCVPVQGFDTQTRNSGAPDGTAAGAATNGRAASSGPWGMQVTLYQYNPGARP